MAKEKSTEAKPEKPIVSRKEVVVTQYKLVDKILEIPKLVEKPVETITAKELETAKQYGRELRDLFEKIQKIKSYRIQEETLVVKRPVYEDQIVKRPVFQDEVVKIKKYELVTEEVKIPKLVEIPVNGLSVKDLELVKAMTAAVKELRAQLEGLRSYKLQEEIVRYEKPVFVKKDVETERIVFTEKLIEDLEGLMKLAKSKKA